MNVEAALAQCRDIAMRLGARASSTPQQESMKATGLRGVESVITQVQF